MGYIILYGHANPEVQYYDLVILYTDKTENTTEQSYHGTIPNHIPFSRVWREAKGAGQMWRRALK